MDSESKVAANYVRFSTEKQILLARSLKDFLKIDLVYVYDSCDYFKHAQAKIANDTRYLYTLDGKVGVLSYAAQKAFKTNNTYIQYTARDTVKSDSIGVFI